MADEEVLGAGEDESSVAPTSNFWSELLTSPINLALLGLCCFLLYQIVKSRRRDATPNIAELPPLKKQDFTLEQLRKYDGRGEGGRILMAVNGRVFDVTKGRKHYGPGGPYGVFAGRDASRGLGTFSVKEDAIKNHFDDLSDLTSKQMESILEWELQFMEKYQLVGRLLKDGEEPTDYTDTEEEMTTSDKSKAD